MARSAVALSDAEVNRITDSGVAILAMRESVDDQWFREDEHTDQEGGEEWRGHLTGRQMRSWVRRTWDGGERGFIADNELDQQSEEEGIVPSGSALRKAEEKGKAASFKKQPRSANPYEGSDPQHDLWDQGWRRQSQEGKAQG